MMIKKPIPPYAPAATAPATSVGANAEPGGAINTPAQFPHGKPCLCRA